MPEHASFLTGSPALSRQVDPAGFEISGHLILKRKEDYDNVTQEWVWRLLSFACLSDEEFDGFTQLALGQE